MSKAIPSRAGAAAAFLLAVGAITALLVAAASRPARGQSDEAWVPITLLYQSDVKGHIEPCG